MGRTASHHQEGSEYHTPVLLAEVLSVMKPKPGSRFIDATLGDGGHAEALLIASAPNGRVLGIDRDTQMLSRAGERLKPFGDRITAVHGNFSDIAHIARREGFMGVDGILFDFGVASWHFDASGRGFSFQGEEPLDMRLSETLGGKTAAELINHASREEIERILRDFGEEPEAGRVADAIVRRRPITTTRMLVDIITTAKRGRTRHHAATRAFQALRIAVNDEIASIETALPESLHVLALGGVVAVMAYHSLEDRVVKLFFREQAKRGMLELLWKKPRTPGPKELERNPRSRSVKFRAARLLRQPNSYAL